MVPHRRDRLAVPLADLADIMAAVAVAVAVVVAVAVAEGRIVDNRHSS
jgi:hypothetical protein